jgi:hypothetical protein
MPLTVGTPLSGVAICFNPVAEPVAATYTVPHSTILVLAAQLTSGFNVEQPVAMHYVMFRIVLGTIPSLAVNLSHVHLSANKV